MFDLCSAAQQEVKSKVFVEIVAVERVAAHSFGETHLHELLDFVIRCDLTRIVLGPLFCSELK